MGQLGRIQAVHEEGGGKNDLGSQCTMVGSPVDQGVSIRLDTGRKKGIKKNATEVLKISRTELITKLKCWDKKANGIPNYVWKVINELKGVKNVKNGEKNNE